MDLRETQEHPSGSRHPWETARFWFFHRLLDATGRGDSQTVLLDVGAGDAWFSRTLTTREPGRWQVHCVDPHYSDAFLEATVHQHTWPRFSRTTPPGLEAAGLLLLDVLEHVEDDLDLLVQSLSAVRPGGCVLISVPAWPGLYSGHDRFLKHFRRYTFRSLRQLVADSGLIPVRSGGLFFSLLPLRALQVWIEKRTSAGQACDPSPWAGGPVITRLLHGLLTLDAWICDLLSRIALPIPGLSWWYQCRKP